MTRTPDLSSVPFPTPLTLSVCYMSAHYSKCEFELGVGWQTHAIHLQYIKFQQSWLDIYSDCHLEGYIDPLHR